MLPKSSLGLELSYNSKNGNESISLLRRVDDALYRTKRSVRRCAW